MLEVPINAIKIEKETRDKKIVKEGVKLQPLVNNINMYLKHLRDLIENYHQQ